jgi:hypothetical protein
MNSKRIKAELSKFQIEFKQNGINAIHQHLQANTTIKQYFYNANHPYLMKIAHIKENLRKTAPLQIINHL